MSNISRTSSNKFVDLSNFRKTINNVCARDIAHSGAHLCRYGGHSPRFCPVNDHSRLVSYLVEDDKYKPLGLLHDAAESYFIEMPRPLKILLPNYRKLEYDGMMAILEKFKVYRSEKAWKKVKEADELAYLIERVVYWGDKDTMGVVKMCSNIKWCPAKTFAQGRALYLKRWCELGVKGI